MIIKNKSDKNDPDTKKNGIKTINIEEIFINFKSILVKLNFI